MTRISSRILSRGILVSSESPRKKRDIALRSTSSPRGIAGAGLSFPAAIVARKLTMSLSRGLTILLLVSLPANCAGSPTPKTKEESLLSDRIFYIYAIHVLFRSTIITGFRLDVLCCWRESRGTYLAKYRTSVFTAYVYIYIYTYARRYRCALNRFPEQRRSTALFTGPTGAVCRGATAVEFI